MTETDHFAFAKDLRADLTELFQRLSRPGIGGKVHPEEDILRSWNVGTRALVPDAGWYATLPSDVAPRIPAADDMDGTIDTVRALAADSERFRRIGEAAGRHVLSQHAPHVYASRLADVLAGSPGSGPLGGAARCRTRRAPDFLATGQSLDASPRHAIASPAVRPHEATDV